MASQLPEMEPSFLNVWAQAGSATLDSAAPATKAAMVFFIRSLLTGLKVTRPSTLRASVEERRQAVIVRLTRRAAADARRMQAKKRAMRPVFFLRLSPVTWR